MLAACGAGERSGELPAAPHQALAEAATGTAAPARANDPGHAADTAASAASADAGPLSSLGDGFAVWESNRSGDWRIWIRGFEQAAPRQLSADEPGRAHCCPHISPDGRRIAYLSLRRGDERYPTSGATGRLHLMGRGGTADRVLLEAAQTYFEHRAAVWRDAGHLIAIGGDGATLLVDAETGKTETLVARPAGDGRGWLLDPSLRHATTGSPGFARYDAARRQVIAGTQLAGCQPYFSRDGRWGYWVAGAGGPIRRLDLASGETANLLEKSDRRLPKDRGYLYFPMLSPDATLLAWAASDGTHDHQSADYDVFVAETDPSTFALIGEPLRVTDSPATDRFPDVFLAPLALGRHFGEAPLRVALRAPAAGAWRWRFGDGQEAAGETVTHRFERPGVYRIEASRAGRETLHGLARVRAPRPPAVIATEVLGLRTIVVRFDEAIDAREAVLRFTSGRAIAKVVAAEDQRLEVQLTSDFDGPDTLVLAGIRDRATSPNQMAETAVEISAPRWPASRDGLVLLWQSAKAPNQVSVPADLGSRRSLFEAAGRAYSGRDGAMVLAGGSFLADMPTMEGMIAGLRATNAFSLEMTVTPAAGGGTGLGRIFTFSGGLGLRDVTLSGRGDELVLQVNTPETGKNAEPGLTLGTLPRGRASHIVVGYEPGRVVFFRDGALAKDVSVATGGFFHWRPLPLLLGNEWQADLPWRGRIEGLAVYDRVLGGVEVAENARRYAALRAERPVVARIRIVAELAQRSTIPSLESIAPYRDALAVFAYRVVAVKEGSYDAGEIRVVHRVLLGGERLDPASYAPGSRHELVLERFDGHPELASLYRSETLAPRYELPLFYALPAVEQ